ncbi:hypothetical protein LTR85_004103 [Meristemomyces frigidus]|nr:hypothetical protein LTR85_004103 [Meristemomyces frigidus]
MASFQTLPNEVLAQISAYVGRNNDGDTSISKFMITRQSYAVSCSSSIGIAYTISPGVQRSQPNQYARRKVSLPDCHTPLKRGASARRTEVISHLRAIHDVELEEGYGGNEAGRRMRHGEQFRAWLQQDGYDIDLAKFFTNVQDGLVARSGTVTVSSMAPVSTETGRGTSPATPQRQGASASPFSAITNNTSTTRPPQHVVIPRSIRAPTQSSRPTSRVEYELVIPGRDPRFVTFNNLTCVFCSDDKWAEDEDAASDAEYHPEAFSALNEILEHYRRLHRYFSLHVQHQVCQDSSRRRNVVRITLTQGEKSGSNDQQEPQTVRKEAETEWEDGLVSPGGKVHNESVLGYDEPFSARRKQAVVQQQTPLPEPARNGSGHSSRRGGPQPTTSFQRHSGTREGDVVRDRQKPAILQHTGLMANDQARPRDRRVVSDDCLLSCQFCTDEAPLEEVLESGRTGFATKEELWAYCAAQHGDFAAFRY